jgi:hypothetical protein
MISAPRLASFGSLFLCSRPHWTLTHDMYPLPHMNPPPHVSLDANTWFPPWSLLVLGLFYRCKRSHLTLTLISALSLSTDMIVGFCGESEQVCVGVQGFLWHTPHYTFTTREGFLWHTPHCTCYYTWRVSDTLFYTLYHTGPRGQPVIDACGGVWPGVYVRLQR